MDTTQITSQIAIPPIPPSSTAVLMHMQHLNDAVHRIRQLDEARAASDHPDMQAAYQIVHNEHAWLSANQIITTWDAAQGVYALIPAQSAA